MHIHLRSPLTERLFVYQDPLGSGLQLVVFPVMKMHAGKSGKCLEKGRKSGGADEICLIGNTCFVICTYPLAYAHNGEDKITIFRRSNL